MSSASAVVASCLLSLSSPSALPLSFLSLINTQPIDKRVARLSECRAEGEPNEASSRARVRSTGVLGLFSCGPSQIRQFLMHSSSDDSGADSSQGLLQSQHSASTQLLIAFAEGLRSLSKDEAQHGSMVESGALPLLFSLLRPAKRNASSRTLEICAIHAIRGLAQSEAGRQAIQETDIIVKLGSCLGTDERIAIGSVARAAIVQALASLAQKGGSGCRRAIAEAGLIPTLISMLEGPRATSHAAAVTLRYLSHDEAEACLEAGAIDALTKFVSQSESGAAHRDAAHALEVRQDRPRPRAFPLPGLTTSYSHTSMFSRPSL